jgi:hypothetical protein
MEPPEFEDVESEDEREETILRVWRELGRPGVRATYQGLRKRGFDYTEPQVAAVLRRQTAQQVTGPAWRSPGRILAPGPLSVVQMDILDNTGKDLATNSQYKYAYVMVDVFTRLVAVYPARTKTPADSVAALESARTVFRGRPKQVQTDAGAEFKGAFDTYCRRHNILHVTRDLGHRNALGLVDSTIHRLRRAILKEQVEGGTSGWVQPLRQSANALNRRPMKSLYGASPSEVLPNVRTQYVLEVNEGRDMLGQTRMIQRMQDKLRQAGQFRVAIQRSKPSSNPTYSAKIHQARAVEGSMVKDERGDLFRIWLVTPVVGGQNIGYFPKGARPGNQQADEATRSRVFLFAEALQGHLEVIDRTITMREAGAWMQTLPGWRQDGIPVRELVELYPEKFEVGGRGADQTVRLRSSDE